MLLFLIAFVGGGTLTVVILSLLAIAKQADGRGYVESPSTANYADEFFAFEPYCLPVADPIASPVAPKTAKRVSRTVKPSYSAVHSAALVVARG
jgi:hypothetical protein